MEKQQSTRLWIIYLLLGLIILLIVLAMYQIDRQWLKLSEMQAALSEQAKDIRDLRIAAATGRVSATSANSTEKKENVASAFKRAYDATKLASYAQGDWSV